MTALHWIAIIGGSLSITLLVAALVGWLRAAWYYITTGQFIKGVRR